MTNNRFIYSFMSDVESGIGGALTGGLSSAVGGVLGMAFQGEQNANQLQQQQALTNIQTQATEQIQDHSMQDQLQMWQQTNYPAQVQQLQQAGLNPALLYGHTGGGGTTTGSPTGSAGMGIAPSGNPVAQGLNMQAAETAADIKLKNAQADNIAAKTPQESDLMQSQIASINQGINNAKAQETLTDVQAQTQRIVNTIQGDTIDDAIATIRAGAGVIENDMQRAVRQNSMDQNTMTDKINTVHQILIGTILQNQSTKAGIQLTQQQIQQTTNAIQQGWKQLQINQQNANTQEAQQKLNQFVNDLPNSQQIGTQTITKLLTALIPLL